MNGKMEPLNIQHDAIQSPDEPSTPKDFVSPYPISSGKTAGQTIIAGETQNSQQPEVNKTQFDTRQKNKVLLDFNATAAKDAIDVFAKSLKLNYRCDEKISSTITLFFEGELTNAELFELMTYVLQSSGVVISEQNQIFNFNAAENMEKQSLFKASEKVKISIIELKNISAKDLAAQLAQFSSRSVKPFALEKRNAVVLADTEENIAKMLYITQLLDQPLRQNWSKAVIPVRNIPVIQLHNELKEIMPVLGFTVSGGDKPQPEEIHLITVERMQLLVASAANADALKELGRWAAMLDSNDNSDSEKLFVYNVVNANAEDLLKAVSTLFNVNGTAYSGSQNKDNKENQANADFTNINSPASGNTDSNNLNVFSMPVKIFADSANERLIIRTKPKTYNLIKALLQKIDTTPPQVLLQVMIIDISLNDSIKFGIEFMMTGGGDNVGINGGTNYTGLTPGSGKNAASGGNFMIFNPNNPDEKYGYLNALAGKTNVKVVSTPQILITSRNEAKLSVGSKVPIVNSEITNTQSIITDSSDSSTNLVRNIQYQDTGVILKVTPKITRGGRINITIDQTVSEADANKISGIDSPIIKEQILATNMTIRNGQTIICGGMIREKKS
ncbi:MAG: secretin N-terminal domain-containing protein, partial [Victivallaceae bacterium]